MSVIVDIERVKVRFGTTTVGPPRRRDRNVDRAAGELTDADVDGQSHFDVGAAVSGVARAVRVHLLRRQCAPVADTGGVRKQLRPS